MQYYNKLVQHFHKLSKFSHLYKICGWDQAALMPSGGNLARSESMAELAIYIHQLKSAPHLKEWFNKASNESLSNITKASLNEMTSQWEQATALPEKLVEAQSLAGSKCEHAWRTQRAENDWKGFSKNFAEVVLLAQEEAQIRSDLSEVTPYDSMLNLYEPGAETKKLNLLFEDIISWLPLLLKEVKEKQSLENHITPKGPFDIKQQQKLCHKIMTLLGFDFNHGRLDESIHPFCGGVPTDVRITTRYDKNDFMQSLMGVVHETGHARYEQGLPRDFSDLPVGHARSMGIHESQSLFFEMQMGRSSEFIQLITPFINKVFNTEKDPAFTHGNLRKLYTLVKADFIRVDADEITYPAHIILRYEIERDLINKKIRYQDIPELWDQKMQSYLGVSTQGNYKDGCMQDIHWTNGSFGYFPSYTLGAMYAAQFMATVNKKMNSSNLIKSGDFSLIFNWLDENIWKKASSLSTENLIIEATGEPLNTKYFKAHLENRYL